jgi:hypothetical protein
LRGWTALQIPRLSNRSRPPPKSERDVASAHTKVGQALLETGRATRLQVAHYVTADAFCPGRRRLRAFHSIFKPRPKVSPL